LDWLLGGMQAMRMLFCSQSADAGVRQA